MEDIEFHHEKPQNVFIEHVLPGTIAVVGLIGLAGYCCGCGCWRCKRNSGHEDTIEHLEPRKRLSTAYVLWLLGGLTSAHHFYLERPLYGIISMCTFCFFGLGWVLDAVLMPSRVSDFNGRRTASTAPNDSSCHSLLIYFPLILLVLIGVPLILLFIPRIIDQVGLFDIDRHYAQTSVNPYTILEISRGADFATAKSAYRRQSLRWHPDKHPDCGELCTSKMADITKAHKFIQQGRGELPLALLREWRWLFESWDNRPEQSSKNSEL